MSKQKIKIYELPENIYMRVVNYIANSSSNFKTGDVSDLMIKISSLQPIIKEIDEDLKNA